MRVPLALTGPAGAAAYGLDGFRDVDWPSLWCSPRTGPRDPHVIRTRSWLEPSLIDGLRVAHPALVIRHLGTDATVLESVGDRISAIERVELAVEHALRNGLVNEADLTGWRGPGRGDALLHAVLRLRKREPATESYAETRAVQLFRSVGYESWRQMHVVSRGRIRHRVELVIPVLRMRRPEVLLPAHGLLVEIDSREFHERQFEKDHQRQSTYDALGYHWVTFTPNQIERQRQKVQRVLEVGLARIHPTRGSKTPHQAQNPQ